ncbi:Pvc16 family protein [Streptomyces sp. NPDC101393]|uniref:DUF4255 domain-containing protein n=1 Tax=Streptomyces sp. NPDC101393 TaxID=3366141 RepID=UPI0038009AB7
MSDFRGIGGVSATLKTLLEDRMELPDGVKTVPVTISSPVFSAKDTDPRCEQPRVSLFLYRVAENGHLRNQDIPGRGSPAAYGKPPLSLNLHYLITAYGNDELSDTGSAVPLFDDTKAHFLLGSAMRVLHDTPVITEDLTTVRAPSGRTVLHASLRDEFEYLRPRFELLSLEDISKVWTALALRFRLSAAFVVNVVQIAGRRVTPVPRAVGRPVSAVTGPLPDDPPAAGPAVHVISVQTPTVTDVAVRRAGESTEQPYPYVRIGDTLVLRGSGLAAPATAVAFGDLRVPASRVGSGRVEVVVPATALPDGASIPEQLQLQPGVCTVRVVVGDPVVPQSTLSSNEAVVMVVPAVNPTALAYGAGPPRTVTVEGSRLIAPGPGGETVIGRSTVPRSAYLSATPERIVVPVPDTLPLRGAHVLVSAPLADPVPLGSDGRTLDVSIGSVTHQVTRDILSQLPLGELAGTLAAMVHDAAPDDRSFTGTRVDLWGDRLVVVAGRPTESLALTSPATSTLAADLGLTDPQPPGAASGYLSGVLGETVSLSAREPMLRLSVGVRPAVTVPVPRVAPLAALADALRSAINAASAAREYAHALVGTSGSRLLVIPGAAGRVTFSAAPGDDTTVAELQLHARFAVRVRANGAESTDEAFVELPR